MKQLRPDTIKPCKCCKNKKPLSEMIGWTKRQFRGAKEGHYFTVEIKEPLIKDFICKECWPDTPDCYARTQYTAMKSRQARRFRSELSFSYQEFLVWLKSTNWRKMLLAHKARVIRMKERHPDYRPSGSAPAIDRINSWLDYRLDNIQVISQQENSRKGSGPSLGAQAKTMKFFKKLRKKENKTKYEMAKHLGMLPQTYFYLEEKARGCSFEILIMVKNKLNLSWNEMGEMLEDEVQHNAKDKKKEIIASSS